MQPDQERLYVKSRFDSAICRSRCENDAPSRSAKPHRTLGPRNSPFARLVGPRDYCHGGVFMGYSSNARLIALLVVASGIWCEKYYFHNFGGLKGSASLSSFCSSSLLNTRNLAFFLVF